MNIFEYLNRKVPIEDDLCFVIMPFDEKYDAVYHHAINPILEELGFRCMRADQNFASTPIMFEIFDYIKKAKVIIADLTGSNPNVYYELGICHALKRNVILLKKKDSHVPFDLHGIRHFEYEDKLGGESKLKVFLKDALALDLDEADSPIDEQAVKQNLRKACHLWKSSKEVLIKFEEFLEITLSIDNISHTDEEIAFLCHVAAYFGKFMKRMTEIAYKNILAMDALIIEASSGKTTRVPWRAAAMLEHFEINLIKDRLLNFKGDYKNTEIMPIELKIGSTLNKLEKVIEGLGHTSQIRDKLLQAKAQIESEFGQ